MAGALVFSYDPSSYGWPLSRAHSLTVSSECVCAPFGVPLVASERLSKKFSTEQFLEGMYKVVRDT